MSDARKAFQKIIIRRGSLSNLPVLAEAEPALTRDSLELYVGGLPGEPNILLSRSAPETLVAVDYSNKSQIMFTKISGTGSLSYDSSAPSSIGTGAFSVTGNGIWEIDRIVPIAPSQGIGGYADVRNTVGTSTVSFGATFLSADKTEITFNEVQNNFIANSVLTNAVFQHFNSGIIRGEGVSAGNLPTGARWLKPRLQVSGNTGTLDFDNFMIIPVKETSAVFNIS